MEEMEEMEASRGTSAIKQNNHSQLIINIYNFE